MKENDKGAYVVIQQLEKGTTIRKICWCTKKQMKEQQEQYEQLETVR